MDILAFERMQSRRFTIEKALPKTCEWILKHPDYVTWVDPGKFEWHHGFLWTWLSFSSAVELMLRLPDTLNIINPI